MASVGEVVLPDIVDETISAAWVYLESVTKKSSSVGVRTETQVVHAVYALDYESMIQELRQAAK